MNGKEVDIQEEIALLVRSVESAKEDYEYAKQKAADAYKQENECLNQLNKVQESLEKALSRLRGSMPHESNWRQK